jgi:hypothetical protein
LSPSGEISPQKYAAGDPLPSVEIAVCFGSLGNSIRKYFVKESQKQNSEKKPTKQRAAPITQLLASLPLLCTRRRSKPFSLIIAFSPPVKQVRHLTNLYPVRHSLLSLHLKSKGVDFFFKLFYFICPQVFAYTISCIRLLRKYLFFPEQVQADNKQQGRFSKNIILGAVLSLCRAGFLIVQVI